MSQATSSRATLADVLVAVQSGSMADRRRQDMASAVNTIARVLERSLAEIPVDLQNLNAKLKHITPMAMGMSHGRWNNVRSLFRSALALMGPVMRGRNTEPLSEAWANLCRLIMVRRDRIRLSRLLRWLSSKQITPATLTADDLALFQKCLSEEALLRDPSATFIDTARAWNRSVERIVGWPQLRIIRESRKKDYVLPWSAFPESLKRDVDAWIHRLGGHNFADDGPVRPLSPSTLKAREYQLRAFASALVLRGRDPQSLVSLAACLTLDNFIEGLRYFLERLGNKPSPTTNNLATMLKSVARHWVKSDESDLLRLQEMTRWLSVTFIGLTPKNRERLRPFNDEANCRKLLLLPSVLRKEIDAGKLPPHRRRVLGQVAVALELLLLAPIRAKNLAALKIDRHLVKVGKKFHLTIPAVEVKNSVDLDFEIPDESADLIRWYLKKVRTAESDNLALFPSAAGSHKDQNTLAIQIGQTVHRYTGFVVNPHLFRHIGALIYLRLNPGGYEVMRRVLGHKKMDTTSNFYAGLETLSAAKHFDEEILKLRKSKRAGRKS
jgi:integrase